MIEIDPDWKSLDCLLEDRDGCVESLTQYFGEFDPRGATGYTGSRFESFAGGGNSDPDAFRFVCDDLVAVSLLSVSIPGRAALYLLEDRDETICTALRHIPPHLDLVNAEDRHLDAAERLWDEIHGLFRVKRAKTSKLLARKRPRLVPVQDSRTMAALGEPTRLWRPLRDKLRGGLHNRLIDLRTEAGLSTEVSAIRVLDVLLWMSQESRNRST